MKEAIDLLQEYAAIIVGLLIGSLTHFGRLIAEGRMPTITQAIGFLMQLGMVGLMASVITKHLGITDSDLRSLTTAILAISTQEVVQFMKKKAWRPIADTLISILSEPRDPR